MTNDSFTFGGVDMYQEYGIMMLHYDIVLPPLRKRKISIPYRSGSYDYGAKYYDDRIITVECDTRRSLTREEIRELSYTLSKKNQIRFWNEPDKYYIGRIYDAGELKYLGTVGHEFTLRFECDPFAYGEVVQTEFTGTLKPAYRGTAPTPTRITITNAGNTPVNGIQIRVRERNEVY